MTKFNKLWLGFVLALCAASQVQALDVPSAKTWLDAQVAADYARLRALYEDIHANPELAFQEKRTAAKLAAEMRALGFTLTEGVGGTGVVAIYRNGAGPTVLVRTELDALPMEEKTGLPYASSAKAQVDGRETPVGHMCGHDVHMAIWVGAAKALVTGKDRWRGTLMFVGQPAEETGQGAKAMLEDGLYTRFAKPSYVIGIHINAREAGTVAWRFGAANSAANALDITFYGQGGHGASPQNTIDPVVMAARFITDVQTVISREKNPTAFGVISVTSIEAATTTNIIPDEVRVRGTIRTQDEAVRARIVDGVRRTANGVAMIAGAPMPKVDLTGGSPAILNDQDVTSRTAAVLKAAFGAKASETPGAASTTDDFSRLLAEGVPGTLVTMGSSDPKLVAAFLAGGAPVPGSHASFFAPMPEPTIKTGVTAMTLMVMTLLPTP